MKLLIFSLLTLSQLCSAAWFEPLQKAATQAATTIKKSLSTPAPTPLLDQIKKAQTDRLATQTQLQQTESSLQQADARLQALRTRNAAISQRLNEITQLPQPQRTEAIINEEQSLRAEFTRNSNEGAQINDLLKKNSSQKVELQKSLQQSLERVPTLLTQLQRSQRNVSLRIAQLDQARQSFEKETKLISPTYAIQSNLTFQKASIYQKELSELAATFQTLKDFHDHMAPIADPKVRAQFQKNIADVEASAAAQEQRMIEARQAYLQEERALAPLKSGAETPRKGKSPLEKLPTDVRRIIAGEAFDDDLLFWAAWYRKLHEPFSETLRESPNFVTNIDGPTLSKSENEIYIETFNKDKVLLEDAPLVELRRIQYVKRGNHYQLALMAGDVIYIYDDTGKKIGVVPLPMPSGRFDFNGNLIAFYHPAAGREIRIFDFKGHEIRSFPFNPKDTITDFRLSPDGSKVLITESSGAFDDFEETFVYDIKTGQRLFTLSPLFPKMFRWQKYEFGSYIFNKNGSQVIQPYIQKNHDKTWGFAIWDLNTGKQITNLTFTHPVGMNSAGDKILRFNDKRLSLYDLNTQKDIFSFPMASVRSIEGVTFTPSKKRIIAQTSDNNQLPSTTLLDATDGKLIYSVPGFGPASPEGDMVWAEDETGHPVAKPVSPEITVESKKLDLVTYWKSKLSIEQGALIAEARRAVEERKPLDLRNRPKSLQLFNSLDPLLRDTLLKIRYAIYHQ